MACNCNDGWVTRPAGPFTIKVPCPNCETPSLKQMRETVAGLIRAEYERLEEQARIFLKMGFTTEELIRIEPTVLLPHLERGIYPRLILQ